MANRGIGMREWRIDRSDYVDDDSFRAAVQNELAAFEHIGERLGIGVAAAPIRTRLQPDGQWFTTGWYFQTATVPAAAARAQADVDLAPEPTEEEIEAVEAERAYDDVTTFDPVTGRD